MKIVRSPELWLTPLIGLPVLSYYIHHHGLALYGSWIVCVLVGVVPLLAAGLVQSLARLLPWPVWARFLVACFAGGVAGYLMLCHTYYYALFPHGLLDGVIDESRGNVIALYNWQSGTFGIIGAGAAVLARLLALKVR